MTLTEFKKELAKNVADTLEEVELSYAGELPPNPTLEDWYAAFFAAWTDTVGEIEFGPNGM